MKGHFNRGDIEFEDECEIEQEGTDTMHESNTYLEMNNEAELAVNLFPSAGKKTGKMLSSHSIKNLKKKKFNQFLTSKSSMKRYNEDHENELFVGGATNLKKHSADTDSMEFEQLKYDSNEKLNVSGKKVLGQSTAALHVNNKQKLDTL